MLRVVESALKHGFSIEDVSHAYDMWLYEGVIDGDAEPPKVLTIGPDSAGNLLELVGTSLASGDHVVWHAMKCRATYLTLLPTGGR